jgi:hypothetical protein
VYTFRVYLLDRYVLLSFSSLVAVSMGYSSPPRGHRLSSPLSLWHLVVYLVRLSHYTTLPLFHSTISFHPLTPFHQFSIQSIKSTHECSFLLLHFPPTVHVISGVRIGKSRSADARKPTHQHYLFLQVTIRAPTWPSKLEIW